MISSDLRFIGIRNRYLSMEIENLIIQSIKIKQKELSSLRLFMKFMKIALFEFRNIR